MNITELRFLIISALEFHLAALSSYHPGWLLELELSPCNTEERTTYPPQTLTCRHTSQSCSHHFHVCPSAQSLVTKPHLTGKCSLYSRQSCAQLKTGAAFSKHKGRQILQDCQCWWCLFLWPWTRRRLSPRLFPHTQKIKPGSLPKVIFISKILQFSLTIFYNSFIWCHSNKMISPCQVHDIMIVRTEIFQREEDWKLCHPDCC